MSYPENSLVKSYSSAEKQSVYSTDPTDWANRRSVYDIWYIESVYDTWYTESVYDSTRRESSTMAS